VALNWDQLLRSLQHLKALHLSSRETWTGCGSAGIPRDD